MAESPDFPLFALRRLLTLAEELLRAPGLKSVFELLGPACHDLLLPDEALLMLDVGDQSFITALDRQGLLQRADPDSALCGRMQQALARQAPVIVQSVPLQVSEEEEEAPARQGSLLAVPFPVRQPSGVLAVLWYRTRSEHRLGEAFALLEHLGELTGAALANIDLRLALEEQLSTQAEEVAQASRAHARELRRRDDREQALDRIAMTDELTGMLNRRGFFLHAEQSLKLARRHKKPCVVIFADIDGLKAINDELGHQFGDRLIQAGAQILHSSLRDSDIIARLGGDEFAALTLDAEQPETILERIRENTLNFHRQQASTPYRVSFSTGIVRCEPDSSMSLADYLALADQRMYEDKKGRAA